MKYIEELSNGDAFMYSSQYFLVTCDFKQDNSKLCYSLNDGTSRWFSPDSIIDRVDLCLIDKDNNISLIKQTPKT